MTDRQIKLRLWVIMIPGALLIHAFLIGMIMFFILVTFGKHWTNLLWSGGCFLGCAATWLLMDKLTEKYRLWLWISHQSKRDERLKG